MNFLFLLAEEAAATVSAPPPEMSDGIMGLIIGQFGALVLAVLGLVYTWKKIIPEIREGYQKAIADLKAEREEAQGECKELRNKASLNRESLRATLEAKEEEAERAAAKWRSRYMKEKGLHTWYQSRLEALCEKHGEDIPRPPADAEKTHYEDL